MQGWIQMIMTNFNEEAGNLNFLPSCHDCSMVVQKQVLRGSGWSGSNDIKRIEGYKTDIKWSDLL